MIYVLMLIFSLLFTSCAHQEKKMSTQRVIWGDSGMELLHATGHGSRKTNSELVHVQLQHVKYADIAVPLDARPLSYMPFELTQDIQGNMLAFELQSSMEAIQLFYEHQMEALGWQIIALVHGAESVLLFDKPQHICSVSLRPVHKNREQKVAIVIAWNDKKLGIQ